jgi:FixJ family two-component response regulator
MPTLHSTGSETIPGKSEVALLDRDVGPAIICVVDDDDSVLRALRRLLAASGFAVEVFSSAEGFLASTYRQRAACLVLDVQLRGSSGFDLQRELVAAGERIPVIFITAHDDAPTRDRARQAGAVRYLRKPFDDDSLLDAINSAIGRA